MEVVITAIGPDSCGLADPIVHFVTGSGANIHEIQMYDHDSEQLFAMLLRIEWPGPQDSIPDLRKQMDEIGRHKGLSLRTWSRDSADRRPRVALCTTYRPEPARAVLQAMAMGHIRATPAVMIGNRDSCRGLAEEFHVEWHNVGDGDARPDNDRLVELFDRYEVDYIVLARYMRVLPPAVCWQFAGGRLLNLHHGLLPSFPGATPYKDAYEHRMLTYGATVHFIVPELDAGNQIVHQATFTVLPGTPLAEIQRRGQTQHEPAVLVEGLRRVVDQEVELHFHRVVRTKTAE